MAQRGSGWSSSDDDYGPFDDEEEEHDDDQDVDLATFDDPWEEQVLSIGATVALAPIVYSHRDRVSSSGAGAFTFETIENVLRDNDSLWGDR